MAYKDRERQRQAQREWYLRNRERKIADVKQRRITLRAQVHEYKRARGCNRCGYNEHPVAIDAHHIGEKFFTISQAVQDLKSWENIEAELDRCELICANCHRIETHVSIPCDVIGNVPPC